MLDTSLGPASDEAIVVAVGLAEKFVDDAELLKMYMVATSLGLPAEEASITAIDLT
jgi:hypothetical protein